MKTRLWAMTAAAVALGAGPALAEDWHSFSHSDVKTYLAEVDGIAAGGDVTRIRVAVVPRSGPAGDYRHTVDLFEFRCAANQIRNVGSVDYGADGAEADRFDEPDAEWEEIIPDSYPAFLKEIACDGSRADPPTWASIKAYVDGGRR